MYKCENCNDNFYTPIEDEDRFKCCPSCESTEYEDIGEDPKQEHLNDEQRWSY